MKLKITLFIFALISFFVDEAAQYLYAYHATNMLLCVYLYALTYAAHWLLLCGIGFLMCIQDLITFGHAGIQLLYLIPLTVTAITMSRVIYPSVRQLICLAVVAGCAQCIVIKRLILGYPIDAEYTIQTIYGILIGVLLISLIIRLSGLLGNRMQR